MKKALLFFHLTLTFITIAAGQSLPALIPYLDGNKWGYADTNGHVMIKPQWRYVNFFKNGRAEVYMGNRHCLIDTHGAYIIPPDRDWNGKFYNSVIGAYYNAKGKQGKYCIIDSNNNEILPCLYDKTNPGNGFTASGGFTWDKRQNKYAAKVCRNGKLGIIDTLNRILIPFEYDGIAIDGYPFSSPKYYVVQKNGKSGVIDAHNRIIIPPKYENIWLDEHNDNQIMVFMDKTTAIADTNGNIVVEIPGYTLGFPRDSLIPVEGVSRQYGLMNYSHQIIIPCSHQGVGIRNDTIVVSDWFTDSAQKNIQKFKYYDIHTFQEVSDWLTYEQYARLPTPVEKLPPVQNKKLPHFAQLHIQGKDVYEYKIGNILWSAIEYPKMPGYFISVRGISAQDTTAMYAAIIDSNGNYVVAPQLTNDLLTVINAADSLIIIQKDKGSLTSVVDFHMKTIIPFQQFAIANAFYYNDTFYAITQHDRPYGVSWHSFEGGGTYEAHDYTYFLVTVDGKPAKAMEHYKLHWYADSNGYRIRENKYDYENGDAFGGTFKGHFMVSDSLGKNGIVTIYGQMLFPSLSFKYYQFNPVGPDVFLVNNDRPEQHRDVEQYGGGITYVIDFIRPRRGLPYLVNRQNNVLLDSLSIETAANISEPGAVPLYHVCLKRPPYYSGNDIWFNMDNKGSGYYGNLPGEKKTHKKEE